MGYVHTLAGRGLPSMFTPTVSNYPGYKGETGGVIHAGKDLHGYAH
jgi:hypothetical protein